MWRWAAAGVLVVAALASASPAPAQGKEAAAEGLFQDAVALRKAGKWKLACEKFRASQKLAPARGTLLNIAECHEHFNELSQAWAAYRRLAEIAKVASDQERLGIALARIQVLEPRLPRLIIKLSDGARVPGLRLLLDGDPIDLSLRGVGIPVDSGRYTVAATAPGHFSWTTAVTVAPGGSETVVVPALRSTRAAEQRLRRRQIYAGAFAAAGLVGLGTAGVFGLRARGDWNDAQAFCAADDTCTAPGLSLISSARSNARIANIAAGLGAGAAIAGVVLWLTRPSLELEPGVEPGTAIGVAPIVAPGDAGLSVSVGRSF